jgi:hypothetical protein
MMSSVRQLLVSLVCCFAATKGLAASLQFETQSKSGGQYLIEIASDADFSKIIHTSKAISSVRYQWTGATYDQIYHWRTSHIGTKEVLGRGTYAVIGPGSGFVSLMWDDHDLSTSSFDLTNEVSGKKASLERVSQNWSSRKRLSKAQIVSVRPAGVKSNIASFVPSLSLAKGESKPVVEISRPKKSQTAKSVVSPAVLVAKPIVANAPAKPLPEDKRPAEVKAPVQEKLSAPVPNGALTASLSSSRTSSGIPNSRFSVSIGGEYSLIEHSKAEIEVDSARASGRIEIEYTRRFASRGIFSLGLHESSSQGRATVESDFALPEINLPGSSRRVDLTVGFDLLQSQSFRFGLGLSVAQNQSWGIALAYSSLDGGAVFEKYRSDMAGVVALSELVLSSHLVAKINISARTGLSGTDSHMYNLRSDLLYRMTETLEIGASSGIDQLNYSLCHADETICEREGIVTANESRSYVQMVVGYAWGNATSN